MKLKTVYVCQQCGGQTPKWAGRCPSCGEWNSLVEEVTTVRGSKYDVRGKSDKTVKIIKLSEVERDNKIESERFSSGSSEFDRVLGGGIVPGSVVLVAGEPGMGKSTLLTQLALRVAGYGLRDRIINDSLPETRNSVLYVCGEESPNQVALRVKRLSNNKRNDFQLLAETDVDLIGETVRRGKPRVLIVDSIQMLTTDDLGGMSGSVGQVKESANRLVHLAKETGIAIFLVGHVTKDGTVAGPKVLEHMVDCVVEITGERTGMYRLLKTLKNRFGATDEVGVMLMEESGLQDVANPSGVFLEESQVNQPGRAVVAVMEGTRTVLVEIQALAVLSTLPQPRRVAQGVPLAKIQVMLAVLQKWGRLNAAQYDVFVSVVGGMKLVEPGVDLAMAMAIASSITGKIIPEKTVLIGEVGLLGEIRTVAYLKKRIAEAKRLGFSGVIAPPQVTQIKKAIASLI